jgi:hypothetical protein
MLGCEPANGNIINAHTRKIVTWEEAVDEHEAHTRVVEPDKHAGRSFGLFGSDDQTSDTAADEGIDLAFLFLGV